MVTKIASSEISWRSGFWIHTSCIRDLKSKQLGGRLGFSSSLRVEMAGHGRSSAYVVLISFAALLLLSAAMAVEAASYIVGGSEDEWQAPGTNNGFNSTYLQDWARAQTFFIGDILIFKYDNTVHDVWQVNATSYANCVTMDPIKSYTSGNDSVPINATTTYFMCSTPYHCEAGQKMAITATPSNASTTPPSPSPSPPPPPSSEAFRHASTSTAAATVFTALIVLFSTWGLGDV